MSHAPIRLERSVQARPITGPARMMTKTNTLAARDIGTCACAWAAPWKTEIARCAMTMPPSQIQGRLRVLLMPRRRTTMTERDIYSAAHLEGDTASYASVFFCHRECCRSLDRRIHHRRIDEAGSGSGC